MDANTELAPTSTLWKESAAVFLCAAPVVAAAGLRSTNDFWALSFGVSTSTIQ